MYQAISLLIIRLGFGGLMLCHGWPKFLKIVNNDWSFANPIGLGEPISLLLTVFSEFICSLFIIVGFKTRYASIPLAFTMFVAAFIVHGGDPMAKKELPLLFCMGFVVLILQGGGDFSIDSKLRKSK